MNRIAAAARSFVEISRASVRVVRAWIDWIRAIDQLDDQMIETMTKHPTRRILRDLSLGNLSAHDLDVALQKLHRLRVLCEVEELDYGQLVQFAQQVYNGGDRTWDEALDAAIEAVEHVTRRDGLCAWDTDTRPPRPASERAMPVDESQPAPVSESMLHMLNRLCREVEDAVNERDEPDTLDTPNPRLPFTDKGK